MFAFPIPPGHNDVPVYTGDGFIVGAEKLPVLVYEPSQSGWTDELTHFHEQLAGDSHPIDVASRRDAIRQIRKHVNVERPVILDIGCSSGFLLRDLKAEMPDAHVIGADYVAGPLCKLSRELPGIPLMQFDLVKCPLPDSCVDVAVLLNVFEHIEDDVAAMAQLFRILKPGGVAVIELPAGPELYDVYDKHLMHFRRYELTVLKKQVSSVGFQLLRDSHLGCLPYPAFAAVKRRNQKYLSADPETQKKIVAGSIQSSQANPLLGIALGLEVALGGVLSYPFGIRALVTCRKPQ